MRRRIPWVAAGIALVALALACSGCGQGAAEAAPEKNSSSGGASSKPGAATKGGKAVEEEAVPVEVAALETGHIESVLRFSANLEAERQVGVYSEAKRLVRQLLVEEGDRVGKGQVLLRLQDDEQRGQLAKVKSQVDKAEREYKRQKELREQQLISQQVFANAIFDLEQLQLSLIDAQRELGYTDVRAPISGTLTARKASVGDQVQIGQHLFDIVDFDSIVARIFVPEKHLVELRPGLEARVSSGASGGPRFRGEILRIAPVVDPQTGTIKVTVAMNSDPGLRPGLYVDVDLVTATHAGALLVPKRAIVYDRDQMFVYRLGPDRRVERVFFEPALSDKDFVEPRAGLSAGDRVVVAGQAGLKDKALVALPEDPAQGDAPAERASR